MGDGDGRWRWEMAERRAEVLTKVRVDQPKVVAREVKALLAVKRVVECAEGASRPRQVAQVRGPEAPIWTQHRIASGPQSASDDHGR